LPINPNERFEDPQEASRQEAQGNRSDIWTAVPVIFKKHNADKGTVSVQPTIKLKTAKPDGTTEWKEMPLLQDVPLLYPGGGGIVHTFPVKDGDEGLVIFSSRPIDKWWHEGGVQEQNEFRMHDISDGFAIPGFRSQPKKLSNVSTTKHQIRTEDGKLYIELDPESGKLTIKSEQEIKIDAPSLLVTGDIKSEKEIIAKAGDNQIKVSTHKHSGVQSGASQTQAPVSGT
jgi:hypothetical protein